MGPAGSSHFSPRLWVEDFFPFPLAWRPSLRFFPSSLIRHWAFSPSSSPSPLPHSPCRHRKTSPKPVLYTHRQTFLIWARVSSFCESLFLGARRWCHQDWYCQEQRGREVYRKLSVCRPAPRITACKTTPKRDQNKFTVFLEWLVEAMAIFALTVNFLTRIFLLYFFCFKPEQLRFIFPGIIFWRHMGQSRCFSLPRGSDHVDRSRSTFCIHICRQLIK